MLFFQKTANKSNVNRMTDASKYTGAHKSRFDADGKGKFYHKTYQIRICFVFCIGYIVKVLYILYSNICRINEINSGKGLEGRKDMDKNTGYVGNYKGDGTYDKSH